MRKNLQKKAHLNLSINPDVLELFDLLEPIHGREYSEFVEEKLLELIEQLAPDMIQERQIKELRDKTAVLEDSLPSIKFAYSNLRKIKQEKASKVNSGAEDTVKQHQDRMYKKYFSTLKYQAENKISHDWQKLQEDFRFKTKIETQEYIDGRLISDGIKA